MPRQLKTYVTTSGFFDIAVAAPSMTAALKIWGNKNNLFQQGLASESKDPDIVKTTLAHPGVVLRRPVGGKGAFKEQAELPKLSVLEKASNQKSLNLQMRSKKEKQEKPPPTPPDTGAKRKAAELYDLAQRRREQEAQRAEVERQKERERRDRAVEKAQATLRSAREKHEERLAAIDAEREKLDRRSKMEKERWEDEKEKLEDALRLAGRA